MVKDIDKLEADNKEKFLKEFRKLVEKYGYDFDVSVAVVKTEKVKETYVNKHHNR